ncbi:glycosyltransferase [Mucilaginibacter psychrotolerans]|uniref:Glycosyltransferase family 2 protein n=1 Tax=Mucilaginibacter psychrotolerans TaxID=1524096 RepID=A0A4Y8SQE4_9SPHI|nr:glycosyltransferase [Mucilaginibacter psychrotolerans]TFF40875.1 glycosyltransferase family 2 protein [Mucilaginibacter psychrotolerans]
MEIGVTVIICCYNSAERLPETLKHLAVQQVSEHIAWEIIVIDNASTDETSNVARELWKVQGCKGVGFEVLHQPKPGKNYAFEMGVTHSKFEYLITCDDDNWLNSNYIQTAFDLMHADSNIGALGGLGIIEPQQPVLLPEAYIHSVTVNESQKWVDTEHWVYGAGSVYRKSILTNLLDNHWRQITTGRTGSSLICGEDVEICFIFYLLGYKITANDQLVFKHFIPHKRQNIEYIARLKYWMAYTNVLLYTYHAIIHKEKRPIEQVLSGWLFTSLKAIIRQKISLVYKTLKKRESTSIESKLQLMGLWGTFHALLYNRKKIKKHHYHTKAVLSKINQL